MHPIEALLGVGALSAPVTATIAAIRWKKSFVSRPTGLRYWLTLVSLILSASVVVTFILMFFRANFVDSYARYNEDLRWLRLMIVISFLAVIAASFGRGGGRLLSLLTAVFMLGFILLVASIPP